MRLRTVTGFFAFVLSLTGCAGTPTVLTQSQQKTLQSMQLFDPAEKPRFTFYLACTSTDISCINAEHAFDRWAEARKVDMHAVEPTDNAFQAGATAAPSTSAVPKIAALPYRVAVRYAPIVIPGFNIHDGGTSNYTPPKIGYTATIKVFDTASGKLLQEMPARDQETTKPEGDAGVYIRAQVKRFIASLDPAY